MSTALSVTALWACGTSIWWLLLLSGEEDLPDTLVGNVPTSFFFAA
jgi:hypothetical protein